MGFIQNYTCYVAIAHFGSVFGWHDTMITSTKQVMFLVCLFVCLSMFVITNEAIFMNSFVWAKPDPNVEVIKFGDNLKEVSDILNVKIPKFQQYLGEITI